MSDGIYADLYVLVNSRSKKIIESFLNNFIPNREESADEYEIPQYSENPDFIFKKDCELMDYCENNNNINHTIYWRNKENIVPKYAMVFYTIDGKMILGLSIEDEKLEQYYLLNMKQFLKSDCGCIAYETPAPNNSNDFVKMVDVYRENTAE